MNFVYADNKESQIYPRYALRRSNYLREIARKLYPRQRIETKASVKNGRV